MDWRGWLNKWLHTADVAAVAEQIAANCRTAVWEQVHHRAIALGVAEARGYVRVRAAQIVHGQVDAQLARQQILVPHAPRLFNLAMESVVRQATIDLVAARRVSHSQPAARRAA